MTFRRRVASLLFVASLSACGTSGSGGPGGSWNLQPGTGGNFQSGVFDESGRFIIGNLAWDVSAQTWNMLDVQPTAAGIGGPFLAPDGTVYGLVAGNNADSSLFYTLYKLTGSTWSILYQLPVASAHAAVDGNGVVWAAAWESPPNTQLWKRGTTGWEKTYDAPGPSIVKSFFSARSGNLFLTYAGETRLMSASGNALSPIFDCATASTQAYCMGEVGIGAGSPGELLFGDGSNFYRASSATATPTRFATPPKEYPIINTVVIFGGDLFMTAKKETGELPWLLRHNADADASSWSQLAEMPCLGCTIAVNGDDKIFSFDGAGSLWRYEN